MGVVHKLKKEVLDFILNTKKDNPKMGCRKLAEIASEKFDVKISKSSINSIVKGENLSSSVGRPKKPKVEKKKKFEIPSERKLRISKELTSIPLPQDVSSPATKISDDNNDIEVSKDQNIINVSEDRDETLILENVQSELISIDESVSQESLPKKEN